MASFSARFAHNWIRLKYVGNDQPPTREFVGRQLLFDNGLVNARDLYSFIALPNRSEFELCFLEETALRRFLERCTTGPDHHLWRDWQFESSVSLDTMNIVVKFWTGRVTDHDVNLYLRRFCDILEPPYKPVDQFGVWYGVRKYKIKVKSVDGTRLSIPNAVSLGPYSGRIFYPGQSVKCFTCGSDDHQVKDCNAVKCWRCGCLGHKAKECENPATCNLCGSSGHTFFSCPGSYANKAKAQRRNSRFDENATAAASPDQLTDNSIIADPTIHVSTQVKNCTATSIGTVSSQPRSGDLEDTVGAAGAGGVRRDTWMLGAVRARGRRASADVPRGLLRERLAMNRCGADASSDGGAEAAHVESSVLEQKLAHHGPQGTVQNCVLDGTDNLLPGGTQFFHELPASSSEASGTEEEAEDKYDSASDELPSSASCSEHDGSTLAAGDEEITNKRRVSQAKSVCKKYRVQENDS